jgi:hypothetical protein
MLCYVGLKIDKTVGLLYMFQFFYIFVSRTGAVVLSRCEPRRATGRSRKGADQHSRGASAPAAGAPGAHTFGPERF